VKTREELPEKLRPFAFHGLDLKDTGVGQYVADCPDCERRKWSCSKEGLWDCKVCATKGNAVEFLRHLHLACEQATTPAQYEELAADRKLLDSSTLVEWQVAHSSLSGAWVLPGYSEKGAIQQLYKYVEVEGKRRLLATPGMRHKLHGVNLYDADRGVVYLCEGPWDGMALWEVLRQTKETGDGLRPTSSAEASMAADASVLAVPGCSVFDEAWLPLFAGKDARLMYDNDHPVLSAKTGKEAAPGAFAGLQRVARMLKGTAASVGYLYWGAEGYCRDLPSGYDVRDALLAGAGPQKEYAVVPLAARQRGLENLLERLREVPEAWEASPKSRKKGEAMECLPCEDYHTLVTAWRKAIRWIPGLDHALAVMLASVASTKTVGDQLWVKVMGPASCGKSTLCEAVSVASKYVIAKSTLRGFHSGYNREGEDTNFSFIAAVKDKTLVTKDGDALLQSPNLSQILSEARDLYDGTSRSSYRNEMSKDWAGIRMTWILCGTSSLRVIDSSELGERFLDCVIMEGIDDEVEDDVLNRVIHKADKNMSLVADDDLSTHQSPEMTVAMKLTGGYVHWLRENAQDVLSRIDFPDWAKQRVKWLAKFIAHMRARPSKVQEETAEREAAYRLASQLIRLAKCLALVLNRKEVDEVVMERTRQVALDTSRGRTQSMTAYMYDNPKGAEPRAVAMVLGAPEADVRRLLRFLGRIGVAELRQEKKSGITGKPLWRLTPRMQKMYYEVRLRPYTREM